MYANYKDCMAAGLDPKEVEKIAKGIARYAKKASELGIHISSGPYSGNLCHKGREGHTIVACGLGGNFEGPFGSVGQDENGVLRGEY